MPIFQKGPLSRKQTKQITAETGCSKKSAASRAQAALDNGMSMDYFMDNRFYNMGEKELARYLKKGIPRRYVEAMAEKAPDTPGYEIYRQMKDAKNKYKISYLKFSQEKLLNASEDRLQNIHDNIERANNNALKIMTNLLAVSDDEAKELVYGIKSKFGYSIREIYRHHLYVMSDEEIAEWKKKKKINREEALKKVVQATGWSESKARAHMSHCSIDFGIVTDMYLSTRCYEMEDWQLALYASTRDSDKFFSKFNDSDAAVQLNEKDRLYSNFDEYMHRKHWVNRDTTFEEFLEFAEGLDEVFCKPIGAMAGIGAYKYRIADRSLTEAYDYFMSQPKYIVEEIVEQSRDMAKFHPESVNTVRLITVLDEGEFDAFLAAARFGVNGIVDNFTSGGIVCAVDPKTGIIMSNGCTKHGEIYEVHPATGEKFKGFQIPHWSKLLETAEAALRKIEGLNFVAWDFAIQDDGVSLIEGNAGSDFVVFQTPWFSEGELVRDRYYHHFDTSVYDDMLHKVSSIMRDTGLSEEDVTNRLVEASKQGYDFETVERDELYLLTPEQIRELNYLSPY